MCVFVCMELYMDSSVLILIQAHIWVLNSKLFWKYMLYTYTFFQFCY